MSTITLRSTKGSPLTNTEVDNNFSNLNTDKLEATYAGAMNSLTGGSSIVTLSSTTGVTTGVWKATSIGAVYGGTGQTTYATGDLLYASAANTLSKLAKPSAASYLKMASDGTPSWDTLGLDDITATGTVTTGTWNATTIGTGYGGTGLTSFTANGVVYASSTSALATGSALTYDGTTLQQSVSGLYPLISVASSGNSAILGYRINNTGTGGVDWRMEEGRSAVGEFNITNITQSNTVVFKINTTGNSSTFASSLSASQFIPSSSSIPSNGLYLPAANAIGLATNSTNAIYVDSSQKVGIGTSTPSYRFQTKVASNQNIAIAAPTNLSTGAVIASINDGNSQNQGLELRSSTFRITANNTAADGGYVSFSSGGEGETMRLTSSGGLSFGATGTAYGTSGQVLTSNGNAAPTWSTSTAATTGKAIAMAMVFGG
jgi:hypothetical protein